MAIDPSYKLIKQNIYGYTFSETIDLIKTGSCCNITKKDPSIFVPASGLKGIWTFNLVALIYNYYLSLIKAYSQVTDAQLDSVFNNYNQKRLSLTNYLINLFFVVISKYCYQFIFMAMSIIIEAMLTLILILIGVIILCFYFVIAVPEVTVNIIILWLYKIDIVIASTLFILVLMVCILYNLVLIGILLSIAVSYIGGLFLVLCCTLIAYLEMNYNFCKNIIYCVKVAVTFVIFAFYISMISILLCLYFIVVSCYWIVYCIILFVFAYDVKKVKDIVTIQV